MGGGATPPGLGRTPCTASVEDTLQVLAAQLREPESANGPEYESHDLFFRLEALWWNYEDLYADVHAHLPHLKFKDFCLRLLALLPASGPARRVLRGRTAASALKGWTKHKASLPSFGAVLLNDAMTKCVLLRCHGLGDTWSFPRGKAARGADEEAWVSAAREVREETGFDAARRIDPTQYVEVDNGKRIIRLYMVAGVAESTPLAPQCVKEVAELRWVDLAWLYGHARLRRPGYRTVDPLLKPLKLWVRQRRRQQKREMQQASTQAPTAVAATRPVVKGKRAAKGKKAAKAKKATKKRNKSTRSQGKRSQPKAKVNAKVSAKVNAKAKARAKSARKPQQPTQKRQQRQRQQQQPKPAPTAEPISQCAPVQEPPASGCHREEPPLLGTLGLAGWEPAGALRTTARPLHQPPVGVAVRAN